jgi:hypothetical protein
MLPESLGSHRGLGTSIKKLGRKTWTLITGQFTGEDEENEANEWDFHIFLDPKSVLST